MLIEDFREQTLVALENIEGFKNMMRDKNSG